MHNLRIKDKTVIGIIVVVVITTIAIIFCYNLKPTIFCMKIENCIKEFDIKRKSRIN